MIIMNSNIIINKMHAKYSNFYFLIWQFVEAILATFVATVTVSNPHLPKY